MNAKTDRSLPRQAARLAAGAEAAVLALIFFLQKTLSIV